MRTCAALVVIVLFGALASAAPTDDLTLAEDLMMKADKIVASGEWDGTITKEIRELPWQDQERVFIRLLDSPHVAMRRTAMIRLSSHGGDNIVAALRGLLDDEDPYIQTRAAAYLAGRANDADARKLLLDRAADPDHPGARAAVIALGKVQGDDVTRVLRELMQSQRTPPEILHAAAFTAGRAGNRDCAEALGGLLDDERPVYPLAPDRHRVCDAAAQALENIYEINPLGISRGYDGAPLAARNKGVASWRKWFETWSGPGAEDPWEAYVLEFVDEALAALQEAPDDETRETLRTRLRRTLDTSFCLGRAPGVDAVLAPTVRDQVRIMVALGRRQGRRYGLDWRVLERATPDTIDGYPMERDQQAVTFIRHAEKAVLFPRTWLWSFCRDFAEVYPDSVAMAEVKRIQARAEVELQQGGNRIVLHGRIPVVDPRVATPTAGADPDPDRGSDLFVRLKQEPSNWAVHRALVEYYVRQELQQDHHPQFLAHVRGYPGSEWPFLAEAAYQWRVMDRPDVALRAASKAVLLVPDNAKAHAVRGMIRLAADGDAELAAEDLARAFDLDPASIGDEPETERAVVFLIRTAQDAGDTDRVGLYAKQLGELRPFLSDRRVKEAAAFQALW